MIVCHVEQNTFNTAPNASYVLLPVQVVFQLKNAQWNNVQPIIGITK